MLGIHPKHISLIGFKCCENISLCLTVTFVWVNSNSVNYVMLGVVSNTLFLRKGKVRLVTCMFSQVRLFKRHITDNNQKLLQPDYQSTVLIIIRYEVLGKLSET